MGKIYFNNMQIGGNRSAHKMPTNPAHMRFSPTSFAPSMWGIWGRFGGKFGAFLSFFQFLVEIICVINQCFQEFMEKPPRV